MIVYLENSSRKLAASSPYIYVVEVELRCYRHSSDIFRHEFHGFI